MVIWKKGDATWNGFGFLGESRHGKTPLSFAFARILFLSDKPEIKILDDCFTIEDGRILQCRIWGNRDHLGQAYYTELAQAMRVSGRSITEVAPGHGSYPLGNVVMYLLVFADNQVPFKKQRCHRQEFVEALMSSNPFPWNYPKPGKDIVLQRFKDTWRYFIVHRQKESTKELVDLLVNEAFADSKSAPSSP
jgi:hypothetical protein